MYLWTWVINSNELFVHQFLSRCSGYLKKIDLNYRLRILQHLELLPVDFILPIYNIQFLSQLGRSHQGFRGIGTVVNCEEKLPPFSYLRLLHMGERVVLISESYRCWKQREIEGTKHAKLLGIYIRKVFIQIYSRSSIQLFPGTLIDGTCQ